MRQDAVRPRKDASYSPSGGQFSKQLIFCAADSISSHRFFILVSVVSEAKSAALPSTMVSWLLIV